jgi:hypothetical protein
MKKLALFVCLAFATPVLACPHMDGSEAKTADQPKKDAPAKAEPPKDATAKDTSTNKDQKPADTAKAKEATPAPAKKTGDKVSQK